MKSLYESILTSTKAGKNFDAEKVIEWFKSTNYYKRNLEVYDLRITADYKNGKWAIDIVGDPKDSTFIKNVWFYELEKFDTQNNSGVLPYKLHSISKNGEPININYHALKFKDSSEFVEEVHNFISLCGCEVDKIDSLPKNCKEIKFAYKHMIGGGRPTVIKEMKNITVDKFTQDNIFSRRGGLALNVNRIKNITVKDEMFISDEMLGYYSLDKGGRKFKRDASDMLNEFFKNNKVDPKICKFIVTENNNSKYKSGSIWYDKEEDLWHFKGEQM